MKASHNCLNEHIQAVGVFVICLCDQIVLFLLTLECKIFQHCTSFHAVSSPTMMNASLRQHARTLQLLPILPTASYIPFNCSNDKWANRNSVSGTDRASGRTGDNGKVVSFLNQIKSCTDISKGSCFLDARLLGFGICSANIPRVQCCSSFAALGDRNLKLLSGSVCYSTQPLHVDHEEKDGAAAVAARGWQIAEESVSDWRGHAAAIARSLQLIKARLRWKEVLSQLQKLEMELERPDLWQDPQRATTCSQECGSLSAKVEEIKGIERQLLEHVGMAELAREENDTQIEIETTRALATLRKIAKETELEALLSGEHDSCSCFLEVQAGAGGTESMDWAAMVFRMYKMWALRRNFEVTVIDEMSGEEAGIKRATLRLDGQFAYGYTKSEAGVHRLVRISPFDSGKRRHTSFAAVAVIPVLDQSLNFSQINESDLRIERYRAGGPGGQHANKTESAVRIIHIPTGITVQSQAQRSQHQNKQTAMDVLQARLHQMEKINQAQAAAQHTQSLSEISWGNQIRSYVLQPYQVVKDLRTGYEVTDPSSVLDGDIDGFILQFLASTSLYKGE
ncbi:hypothetical protein O6H91_01G004300 [Diphasiastrum complanatum]|uniref:Uncharacterized protein n=1 Tax=Diphasiastrum complanatum TaxID=34168 RepID=A0ACC2EMK8_DIPCM|nr:hypothetical protein O6H91_01G004300 [Diphasiastrum complanatum]